MKEDKLNEEIRMWIGDYTGYMSVRIENEEICCQLSSGSDMKMYDKNWNKAFNKALMIAKGFTPRKIGWDYSYFMQLSDYRTKSRGLKIEKLLKEVE